MQCHGLIEINETGLHEGGLNPKCTQGKCHVRPDP